MMSEQEVKELMESSTSEQDWNNKCDEVKKRCNGYPNFWYDLIIASGLGKKIARSYGGDFGMKILTM